MWGEMQRRALFTMMTEMEVWLGERKKAVYGVDKESTVKAEKEILCLFAEHIYASVYGRVME